MKSLLAALLLPLSVLALPAAAPRPGPDAAGQERAAQRQRTRRVVGLAEALQLDEAGALRIDEAMRPFDAQRRPLQEKIRAATQTLERAAKGDSSAYGLVDSAERSIAQSRADLAGLHQQMRDTVAKGLTAQQRAQLDLFFAHRGDRGMGRHRLGRGAHKA